MIYILCPVCGSELQAADDSAGKPCRCALCGAVFEARGFVAAGAMPAEAQGLDIVDRQPMWQRPVSAIVGRINAPLYAIMLGTLAPFRPGPQRGDWAVAGVAEGFAHADRDDRLELQLGSSMPLRNIARIWGRAGIGILGKLLGTLLWPFNEAMKALCRMDSYDPFAHAVALYHNDPAILAHELGHAQDFARRNWRTLYTVCRALPPVALYQEWKASCYGVANLKARGLHDEVKRANRLMGGGFGSYVGALLRPLAAIPAALIGQVIGAAAQPFGRAAVLGPSEPPEPPEPQPFDASY